MLKTRFQFPWSGVFEGQQGGALSHSGTLEVKIVMISASQHPFSLLGSQAADSSSTWTHNREVVDQKKYWNVLSLFITSLQHLRTVLTIHGFKTRASCCRISCVYSEFQGRIARKAVRRSVGAATLSLRWCSRSSELGAHSYAYRCAPLGCFLAVTMHE